MGITELDFKEFKRIFKGRRINKAEFGNRGYFPIKLSELKRLQIFLNKLIENVEEAKRIKENDRKIKRENNIPY